MKKIVLFFLTLLLVTSLNAQKNYQFLLGVEVGGGGINGELNENWSVRQDVNPYSDYYNYSSSVNNLSSLAYFGFKPELSFFNKRLSTFSGLRFTQLDSYLGGGIDGNYFFLRYKDDASGTEYARVNKLTEKVNYLSVPFELRFVPVQISNFGFYLKVGTEIGLKLSSKRTIEFTSTSMEPYEDEVLNSNQSTTNNLYSTFYSAIGVRWESIKGANVNIEILLPSKISTKNNLTLITPDFYSGFQFSVAFPIKKN